MANVLQFTLGLEVSKFLEAVGWERGILSLAGRGNCWGYVGRVMGKIRAGAELEHLSKRTRESVGSLFELERGFAAAGLSADDVGPAIFMLRRSLGGTNEMGEKTADVFKRSGFL